MNSHSKVTLQKIAQKANVSASTVSRALNGFAFVEESTRLAILEVANELGYTARERASKVAKAQTVLLLVRDSSTISDQEMSLVVVERRLSNGVIDSCQRLGLSTLIRPVKMDERDFSPVTTETSLIGAIFLGGMIDSEFARLWQATGKPFAVAGAAVAGVAVNCVTADYAGGAEKAVHFLIKQGRRHIALVNGSAQTTSSEAKYKGFRLALTLNQLPFCASHALVGDFSAESGYAKTCQLLTDAPATDAILYGNDEMAIGGLHALKACGRAVPTDVAVIGFYNTHGAQFTDPPLTSVEVDLRQMGRIAGELLYQLYLNQEQKYVEQQPWTVMVPTTLVSRQST